MEVCTCWVYAPKRELQLRPEGNRQQFRQQSYVTIWRTVMKTLEQVSETLGSMIKTAKALPGFRFDSNVVNVVQKEIPALINDGRENEAIRRGEELIKSLHAVLGAFVRYSVMPKKLSETETREGRFTQIVRDLDEKERFDEDLIAGLNKKLEELKAAVNTETNGSFDIRIAAYTAMHEAVDKAVDEQKKRDHKRAVLEKASKKAARDKADAEATERNKAHAQSQRQALLQQRKAQATAFSNLL